MRTAGGLLSINPASGGSGLADGRRMGKEVDRNPLRENLGCELIGSLTGALRYIADHAEAEQAKAQ